MKRRYFSKLIVASLVLTLMSCGDSENSDETTNTNKGANMDNELDKVSYSLGVNVAYNMQQQGVESINAEAMAEAVNAVYNGDTLKLTPQEAGQTINDFIAEKKAKAGRDFLAQNKTKEGVVELPSGLQYKILVEGNGPKPVLTDQVKTHYHGTFIDGSVFDSSVQRGEPIVLGLTGVIPGWTEALQLMPVGSKWQLFIPFELAYGPNGRGSIPPYSTLIFEMP